MVQIRYRHHGISPSVSQERLCNYASVADLTAKLSGSAHDLAAVMWEDYLQTVPVDRWTDTVQERVKYSRYLIATYQSFYCAIGQLVDNPSLLSCEVGRLRAVFDKRPNFEDNNFTVMGSYLAVVFPEEITFSDVPLPHVGGTIGSGPERSFRNVGERYFEWRYTLHNWTEKWGHHGKVRHNNGAENIATRTKDGASAVQRLEELGFQVFWRDDFQHVLTPAIPPQGWSLQVFGTFEFNKDNRFIWRDPDGIHRLTHYTVKTFPGIKAMVEFH